jgi:hypothetical protein
MPTTPTPKPRTLTRGVQVGRLFDRLMATHTAEEAERLALPEKYAAKRKAMLEAAPPAIGVLALELFEKETAEEES